MKKWIIIAIFIGCLIPISSISWSQTQPPQKSPVEKNAKSEVDDELYVAKYISDLAAGIMQKRQNGVDISTLMETASQINDKSLRELVFVMIRHAYTLPRFNLPEYKKNAIQDFKNDWYLKVLNTK